MKAMHRAVGENSKVLLKLKQKEKAHDSSEPDESAVRSEGRASFLSRIGRKKGSGNGDEITARKKETWSMRGLIDFQRQGKITGGRIVRHLKLLHSSMQLSKLTVEYIQR